MIGFACVVAALISNTYVNADIVDVIMAMVDIVMATVVAKVDVSDEVDTRVGVGLSVGVCIDVFPAAVTAM